MSASSHGERTPPTCMHAIEDAMVPIAWFWSRHGAGLECNILITLDDPQTQHGPKVPAGWRHQTLLCRRQGLACRASCTIQCWPPISCSLTILQQVVDFPAGSATGRRCADRSKGSSRTRRLISCPHLRMYTYLCMPSAPHFSPWLLAHLDTLSRKLFTYLFCQYFALPTRNVATVDPPTDAYLKEIYKRVTVKSIQQSIQQSILVGDRK
jgi:hypothetical protein